MLTPSKRKLTVIKGAKFDPGWTWMAAGVPVDLTGCTARMQVRPEIESSDVLLELTTENGGNVLQGTTTPAAWWGGATETPDFTWESGVWSLEIQYAAGPDYADRLIEGSISVSPEVTR